MASEFGLYGSHRSIDVMYKGLSLKTKLIGCADIFDQLNEHSFSLLVAALFESFNG